MVQTAPPTQPPPPSESRRSSSWHAIAAWIAAIVALMLFLRNADNSYVHVEQYRADQATIQHEFDALRDQQQADIQRIENRLQSMDGKLDRLIEIRGVRP